MKISTKKFLATKISKLAQHPTESKAYYDSDESYEHQLQKSIKKISKLQNLLYADNRYALLIVFQAMDAAGKDSTIKRVLSGVNPQGCQVFSFKQPSSEELEHDFLWRTTRCLPERGRFGVFNRSYYEEVLVVRVHPELLDKSQLPKQVLQDKNIWKHRFESIRDFEKHLTRNGTRIIKFFLNVSQEEQLRRFAQRLENSEKNWKFSSADYAEGALWKKYMRAYEDCISETSTKNAPWYIVPADDKKNMHLIVSEIIREHLESLDLSFPKLSKEQAADLKAFRKTLGTK